MSFHLFMRTAQREVAWLDLPESDRPEMLALIEDFQRGGKPMERPLDIVGPSTDFSVRWCDIRDVWMVG